ncbi:Uncharacterised protein [Xylophilus ampelinus]|nr:Uncharacterised protein [Xylophilus ampelinus]
MGFSFRKRIKLLPGVRLNVSKTGLSTSIGGRGASVNIRKGRTRATVGLTGIGLSYSQEIRRAAPIARAQAAVGNASGLRLLALLGAGALAVVVIVGGAILIAIAG